MPRTWFTLKKSKEPCEDSIALRAMTACLALVGVAAAVAMADTPLALAAFAVMTVISGSWLSYIRRASNNFWIKVAISLAIIATAGIFFDELLARAQANIADARAPLTNMLVALLGLHCFDLPRRRDLNVSAMVGVTLMAVAATLSHDSSFAVYIILFIIMSVLVLYYDAMSRIATAAVTGLPGQVPRPTTSYAASSSLANTKQQRTSAWPPAAIIVLALVLPLVSAGVFLAVPRTDIGIFRRMNVRLNFKWHRSANQSGIFSSALAHKANADGSITVSPNAFHGFASELDLNYRGELGDFIVMRVASRRGQLWRSMAFDTYDGITWTMSSPEAKQSRRPHMGYSIALTPVPTLVYSSNIPQEELQQVFYIDYDLPNLIPTAAVPYQIYFPADQIKLDKYGCLRSPLMLDKDLVYTVFSRVPSFDSERLSLAPPITSQNHQYFLQQMGNYLQLPELPPPVRKLASNVAGHGNFFTQANNICTFLRRNYKYDLLVPATVKGSDTVADFLFKYKRGYCEHFASAFVVLCRCQGIPSRLVTGFAPGVYNPFTGMWEVKMSDAHGWAEVYVPKEGWVPFDPTPLGAAYNMNGIQAESGLEYIGRSIKGWLAPLIQSPPAQKFASAAGAAAGWLARHAWTLLAGLTTWLHDYWLVATLVVAALAGIFALSSASPGRRPPWLAWLGFLGRFGWHWAADKSAASGAAATATDRHRRQAQAAYGQLSRLLARHGIAREKQETVSEFLRRVELTCNDRQVPVSGPESPAASAPHGHRSRGSPTPTSPSHGPAPAPPHPGQPLTALSEFADLYSLSRFGPPSSLPDSAPMERALAAACQEITHFLSQD